MLNLLLIPATHPSLLEKILVFIVLLGVMIVVHELGHYWAAIAVGIRVETFSIGFGPRLFGFRRGSTDFRVSAIPLGGYVRMLGEQPGDDASMDPASFQAKARWQRAIVILAGPLMNIVLAVFVLTALFMNYFPDVSGPAIVTEIAPNSAAQAAGVQPGDRIVQLGTKNNPTWEDIIKEVSLNGDHAIDLVLLRNGKDVHSKLTPQMDSKEGIGIAGWAGLNIEVKAVESGSPAQRAGMQVGDVFMKINGHAVSSNKTVQEVVAQSGGKPIDVKVKRGGALVDFSIAPIQMGSIYRIGITYGEAIPAPIRFVKLSFPDALKQSLRKNTDDTFFLYQTLAGILERRVSPRAMSGPIGVFKATSEVVEAGPIAVVQWMALISLNLAIFNLLPIPILDGGTLVLLATEMLLQRDVSLAIKETVLKVGFVLLMMLVVFVIYSDLTKS